MSKANFNRAFFFTLLLTALLLAGCSSPEERKEARIEEARELSELGEYTAAIEILESLAAEHPNDLGVLSSMGSVYSAEGDHTMAAFFLEQAHLQDPEDDELLFEAYQSLEAADQPAGHLLEKLAEQAPDAMDSQLWSRLAQKRQADNRIQPALDAYLKSTDAETAGAETAAAIGQLYIKIGNRPQAEAWLERAADNDDPNALTALFGLLEIELQQKDWPGAEATLAELEERFPGAVAASEWNEAREELERWREAQDAMQAKLARAEAEKEAAEAEAAEAETAAAAEAEDGATEAGAVARSENDSDDESTESEGGKAQVITDVESAEAMANTPAIEMPGTELVDAGLGSDDAGVRFDPNIVIEPADPDVSFEVDFDQASEANLATYRVDPAEPAPLPQAIDLADSTDLNGALGDGSPGAPPSSDTSGGGPRSIEELLADAELAERDRDFKSAIRKYWAAISISNNRPELWNNLSRAYLIDGQVNNAETAALEAVRLDPREVAYTLDYLRVAQRSKNADAFMADLETAYDRFPGSPEITLSLARAYERIAQENETARSLYRRFIDIAPNHPLVPEARSAIARTE